MVFSWYVNRAASVFYVFITIVYFDHKETSRTLKFMELSENSFENRRF